jgi:hypothetical protein
LSFKIHFARELSPQQVHSHWSDAARPLPPEVESKIESAWRAAVARLGKRLFDGPMVRLDSWRFDDGQLHLTFGHTSYKLFLGTNLTHPELADEFGPQVLANPLGLSAVLESSDGYLLLGRRNSNVAYHPNRIHPFAGSATDGNVFAEMRRELAEELSLGDADITQMKCIGLAEDRQIRQPELIFHVVSKLTKSQIEQRLNIEEHESIWAIRVSKQAVEETMNNPQFTPIATAALAIWLTGPAGTAVNNC